MKDSRLKIDEHLIDELVSGQLTGERYRSVLRALDAEPTRWRDCALAFLEEQALRNELRAMAQGTIDWSLNAAKDSSATLADKLVITDGNQREHIRPSSQPLNASYMSGSFRSILSTAALLLVSFTVGWLGSEVIAERERGNSIDVGTKSVVQNPSIKQPTISAQGEPQFVVDRAGAFDHGIPRPIRELERDGRISVQSFDMLVPTTLEDGSSALVPVQQLILSRGTVESY